MKPELKPNWKNNIEVLKYITLISQLGLVVISALLICFFIGLFLSNHLPGGILWIAGGTILGVIAGSLAAFQLLQKTILKEDEDDNNDQR